MIAPTVKSAALLRHVDLHRSLYRIGLSTDAVPRLIGPFPHLDANGSLLKLRRLP